MKTKIISIGAGLLIGLPLAVFATVNTGVGPLFANIASAGYGQEKVTICHKGKNTLTVGAPAVQAHLGHGDTVGACSN